MPVRYIVERQQWTEAEHVANPAATAQPLVLAIASWARGLGFARNGLSAAADQESATLQVLEERLRNSGNTYWAGRVDIMRREVMAWSARAKHREKEAAAIMRSTADEEDGIEKLPVTPGPILPARELLGELLLMQGNADAAAKAFRAALVKAPGRRHTLEAVRQAQVHH